jgi:RNA polymerase sigma-70 factor, ECF subfamily
MTSKEKQGEPVIKGTGARRKYYEALVNDYYNDIFRYAYWLSKDQSVAEDLVQETFLRAWRSIDSLENEAAAKSWLFTILRRENARLYEKYRPELDDIDEIEISDEEKRQPVDDMERELLYRAMQRLDPDYREPLMLQVVGGFSGEEIASILNLNNNTVMTRLFRARNKLKQDLDR